MKHFTIAFFMLFTLIGFSQMTIQSSGVKTTEAEYSFLTENYNIDSPKILDGYELKDYVKLPVKEFEFNYKLLIEKETGNAKAVSVIITKTKKNKKKVRYLCIPFNNYELSEEYIYAKMGLGVTMKINLETINCVLYSKLIDEKVNVDKKTL